VSAIYCDRQHLRRPDCQKLDTPGGSGIGAAISREAPFLRFRTTVRPAFASNASFGNHPAFISGPAGFSPDSCAAVPFWRKPAASGAFYGGMSWGKPRRTERSRSFADLLRFLASLKIVGICYGLCRWSCHRVTAVGTVP